MDTWERQKLFWLHFRASDEEILATIGHLCEIPEAHRSTILWLSSRGSRGHDENGRATQEAAIKAGGFKPRRSE